MKPLAQVPATLPPHGIRVIMDLAWATPGSIHLEVGEPSFPTPGLRRLAAFLRRHG